MLKPKKKVEVGAYCDRLNKDQHQTHNKEIIHLTPPSYGVNFISLQLKILCCFSELLEFSHQVAIRFKFRSKGFDQLAKSARCLFDFLCAPDHPRERLT